MSLSDMTLTERIIKIAKLPNTESEEFAQILASVQSVLGQNFGDLAGVFFSDCKWGQWTYEERIKFMKSYVVQEIDLILSNF